jgi:hypothetical protein
MAKEIRKSVIHQPNSKSADRAKNIIQKYDSRRTKSIRGTTSLLRGSQTLFVEYNYENAISRNTY